MASPQRLRRTPRQSLPAGLRLCGQALLDLVLPPQCAGCGRPGVFPSGPEVCSACRESWSAGPSSPCVRCGARVPSHPVLRGCKLCHDQQFRFVRCFAIGNYAGALREIVYRLKRRHQEPLAYQVGRSLGDSVRAASEETNWDRVVPLPTHWGRAWQRGGNPAAGIAAGVARELQLPLVSDLLEYARSTKKQGQLSRMQRLENVHRALRVRPYYRMAGLRLLLIDDVMASGATANEAARALLQAGAREVWVAVAARGTAIQR